MADQTTVNASQAGADTGSQVEQDDVTTQAAGTQNGGGNTETISPERYRKVVSEARGLRERLKQYEDKETQALPELERLQKERKEFEQERAAFLQERRFATIEAVARQMGAVYPDAIPALISSDIDTEKEIKQALTKLQTDKPRLFQTGSADGGAATGGNGTANTLDMNALIRQRMGQ